MIHVRGLSQSLAFVLLLLGLRADAYNQHLLNGFDLSGASIPEAAIEKGGPPRDGIPSLDSPRFEAAAQATDMTPDARVLGLVIDGIAKAYPIAILNWHELVNDHFGGQRVIVSYCPLCGTGMAFSSRAAGRELEFGVSGLLYNSDVLLYDRQTHSLWSQILGSAVTGLLRGTRLEPLVLAHTDWQDWRRRHPDTRVLSRDTGFRRDYDRNPYLGYDSRPSLFFDVAHQDPRYPNKEWVLGIEVDGRFRAYPFSELARAGGRVRERFAGRLLEVRYDAATRSARVFDERQRELPAITAFWFAWVAFHPDTAVFKVQ